MDHINSININSKFNEKVSTSTFTQNIANVNDELAQKASLSSLQLEATTRSNTDSSILSELNTAESALGLNADGTATPDSTTNYLQLATSYRDALKLLDTQLKLVADLIPNRGNIGTNVDAKNASTQPITGGVITKVQFPTEGIDTNDEFLNNTFTSKATQHLSISASVSISSQISNGQYLYLYIYKNGIQVARSFDITAANAASVLISASIHVAIGDTIEIYCRHTNGTNIRNLDGNQYLNIKQMY